MFHSKLGLIGLCSIVLSVMAISASTAHASLYTWIVLDVSGTALEAAKAELVSESDSKDLTLLTHISGLSVAITCTSLKLSGINTEAEGLLTPGGRAFFEGCEAYGKGTLEEALKCHLHTAGTGSGIIETGQLKGALETHEVSAGVSELLTKIQPKEGTTFATILTEACTLPEANTINGTIFFKDGELKPAAHLVKHLIEQGPLTSLWIGADTKEHLETSIDGSAWVSVSGGLKWAGKHPVSKPASFSWLVLDSAGKTATELKASLLAEKDSADLTLLTKFLGLKLALTCTNLELVGLNLEVGGKLTEGGKAKFTGCEMYGKGSLEEPLGCNVHTTAKPVGTIETNALKGELQLDEAETGGRELLTVIEPKEGTIFVTFLTEGCPLFETNAIAGKLVLKDHENGEVHAVKHLVEQGQLTSLFFGTDTAEHLQTSIDGSVWVKLGGAHLGLAWAGKHS